MPYAFNAVASSNISPERFMRRHEVEALTGYKTSAIYQKMHDGTFPKAIRIGANRVAWLSSDIQNWMEARIAESRNLQTKGA